MRCLHICNDFFGSAVHRNLYNNLSEYPVQQTIYYPSRSYAMPAGKSMECDIPNAHLIISRPLKKIHRLLFRRKINLLFDDLEQKVSLPKYDIVHATTLFSDGSLALKIKKKYGIPFIVTVRSTDVNGFLRFRKDLVSLAIRILKESERIIFITPRLKQGLFKNKIIFGHKEYFLRKSDVLFNGIDPYWLENKSPKRDLNPTKILYVGKLIRRKNVLNLSKAVIGLNNNGHNYKLTIVGSGGSYEKKIKQLAKERSEFISYKGKIMDKSKLKKVYRENHIFALPSKSETFGLVYIEALSQGLPIIYLKNESVDGMFSSKVGNRLANPKISTLMKSLLEISKEYNHIDLSEIDFGDFAWPNISSKYFEIYKQCVL
ncbi:glycosyltransferase [Ulvibacterium sp.]|uniref:glycosyltransferase n=1 Tax=Ulvibacterium sp. TaxID=2665914 RepID=UPI003BA84232